MPERSLDIRKILTGSLNPERVEKEYQAESKNRYVSDEKREQLRRKLRRNFEEERSRIAEFEKRHQVLLERYAEMSDDDFNREYQEASKKLENIHARVKRHSKEYREHRLYTVEFVDVSKIESLSEFLDTFPMQFIPKKEGVGRILALAKQMHEVRIRRGEKENTEPLRIVDIGGANGALGKLVTDLAEENGLEIKYVVIDPDTPTVQEAARFYENHPSLSFKEQTGEDFNAELYRDNPEITDLLAKRKAIIEQGESKRSDLQKLVSHIQERPYDLDTKAIRRYLKILKTDFGIDWPDSLADNSEEFLAKFENQKDKDSYETRSFIDIYMESWKERINSLTEELEEHIKQQSARYDLVINSWMPIRTDLTKEVREVNGAAILYALERYGATGCRSDAPYPESPSRLGHGESYHPGIAYESKLGWISHSTRQAKHMMNSQPNRFWEYQDSWTPPFANGFVVQTKKGYASEALEINPNDVGIRVEGSYTWEDELTRRGGDISPMVELHDENGELDYFSPLNDLEGEIGEKESQKIGEE